MLKVLTDILKGPLVSFETATENARASLAKSEAEECNSNEQVEVVAAELFKVESAYDQEPSSANGQRVLQRRQALDLVKLRQERATKRLAAARQELERSGAALEEARRKHAIETARRRLAEAQASERVLLARVASEMAQAAERAEAAFTGLAKVSAEREASSRELDALGATADEGREALEERATWADARRSIEPIVAVLCSLEASRAQALATADAVLDGQRQAALALGSPAVPVPRRYAAALVLYSLDPAYTDRWFYGYKDPPPPPGYPDRMGVNVHDETRVMIGLNSAECVPPRVTQKEMTDLSFSWPFAYREASKLSEARRGT